MPYDRVTTIWGIEPPNDKTAPQRFFRNSELLGNDIAWHWDERHEVCVVDLKSALTKAPVLSYFDPDELIMVQLVRRKRNE